MAQSGGALSKAVGGYSFEDAVKEAPGTKDFNSKDGKLTFAIVTHTAGNGFFDPTYVGAKVAADMVGVESADAGLGGAGRRHSARARDPQPGRPGPDHRRPDPDHAAGRRLRRHRQEACSTRASPSPPPTASTARSTTARGISHTGQDASAAAIGGEALAKCVLASGAESGSIIFPSTTTLGNVEVNNRITAAFTAAVGDARRCRQARQLQGRRRPGEHRHRRRRQQSAPARSSA